MSNSALIKEGFVEKYKSGFLSSKWKSVFARLYSDSTLALYSDRGDSRPSETIFIKNVIPYVCVGFMTDRMPVRRPSLPPGAAVQRLVGIGMDPRAEKVHWILFPSEQILEEWLNGIMSTLPPPPNPPQQLPTVPPAPPAAGFVPPPKYPDQPPLYGGPPAQPQIQQQPYYPPPAGGYGAQPQQPYPAQQTVIVDRTTTPSGGYGGSGFGTGLAAGMGGAMLGSLLGYGIGSFFAPHGGWGAGGWGGGGYGHGFGGGYIQDNDTYVTNNYYLSNDDTSTPAQNSGDYSTPTQNDYTDYDGGGGTWDDGGAFDDGGGFDGGGGDW